MRLAILTSAVALLASDASAQQLPSHNWITPPEHPGTEPVRKSYLDGNQLLDYCEKQALACSLYIDGVVDGQLSAIIRTNRDVPYCIPHEATGRQVMDVVVKYLREHPEERTHLGGILVARALSRAWPQCR